MPSHYLNQWWNIVDWTAGNKLQWNLKWNSYIFIQENVFESFDCKIVAIVSRPQCVNVLMYCWEMMMEMWTWWEFHEWCWSVFCCCCWMSEILNVLEKNFSTVSSNQGLYNTTSWLILNKVSIYVLQFSPQACFGLWVLSSPVSVCVSITCLSTW